MNFYIPHRILVIHDQVDLERQNDLFFKCYQLAFDWANQMGIDGRKVCHLYLKKPDMNFNSSYELWCKIECSEKERKSWEERFHDIEPFTIR